MRSAGHHKIPSTTNTSQPYWELRAEQVMDRVFRPLDGPSGVAADAQQPESIEVEVTEAPARTGTGLLWLCGGITGLALISAGLLALAWGRANQDLRQERTLQLLQAVRELGAAASAPPSRTQRHRRTRRTRPRRRRRASPGWSNSARWTAGALAAWHPCRCP